MLSFYMLTNEGEREINEDSIGSMQANGADFFVLADGLGGHGRGEVASAEAVSAAVQAFALNNEFENIPAEAIESAQAAVMQKQKESAADNEMKTTMVCLSIKDNKAKWGHVGDSRLYHFRKRKVVTRTLDHSVPQMLVAIGEIKEKDIRFHEDRNRLLRVIGIEWDSPKYDVSDTIEVDNKDVFLMGSDGFWEWIDEKTMSSLLKKSKTPEEWIKRMQEHICDKGRGKSMDNYSAIAVFM